MSEISVQCRRYVGEISERYNRMSEIYVEFYETKNGIQPAREFILTNGFIKKTQKTPRNEIEKAKKYRADYMDRKESYNDQQV